jgi:hypothetical protein
MLPLWRQEYFIKHVRKCDGCIRNLLLRIPPPAGCKEWMAKEQYPYFCDHFAKCPVCNPKLEIEAKAKAERK